MYPNLVTNLLTSTVKRLDTPFAERKHKTLITRSL